MMVQHEGLEHKPLSQMPLGANPGSFSYKLCGLSLTTFLYVIVFSSENANSSVYLIKMLG